MKVIHFLRGKSAGRAAAVSASADDTGLDAFLAEPTGQDTPPASGTSRPNRGTVVAWCLGALVAIQAGPAALWLNGYLAPASAAATPPAPVVPTTTPAMAACDPMTAPAPPSQNGDSSATSAAAAVGVATAGSVPRPAGVVAGRVAVTSAIPLRIYEDQQLIGTSEAETLLLPVGTHTLQFVNDEVGFRGTRRIEVTAGRTAALEVELPRAPLHVNALPWAEVWVDDQRIGQTPIGNLQQTVGPHDVVFRHPELGERRTTVMVTLKQPARVSIDLRKK